MRMTLCPEEMPDESCVPILIVSCFDVTCDSVQRQTHLHHLNMLCHWFEPSTNYCTTTPSGYHTHNPVMLLTVTSKTFRATVDSTASPGNPSSCFCLWNHLHFKRKFILLQLVWKSDYVRHLTMASIVGVRGLLLMAA